MVDHAREMLTQRGKQLVALHACLLPEVPNRILSECRSQFVRRYRTILPTSNPGARDLTVSTLL
jgi:hypothetical protein